MNKKRFEHLRHPPRMASIVTAQLDDSAASILAHVHSATDSNASSAIYLLDAHERLRGTVPLRKLISAAPNDSTRTLASEPHAMRAGASLERIASYALRYGLTEVPLIDAQDRLVGVVPAHELMAILRREHIEDLHRMAGIRRETAQAREAIEAPPLRRARDRLPWLLAGLAGSAVATLVMARFEAALSSKLAIAFFVPAIVYLADAIGTQTEAIAVRGLSLSHAPMRALMWGEVRTGLLIGTVLGGLAWPAVWLAFSDAPLATAVALALMAAGAVATTVGLLLPWLLARTGRDPAFGSGPLATIVQDVLSLAIYFAVALAILF